MKRLLELVIWTAVAFVTIAMLASLVQGDEAWVRANGVPSVCLVETPTGDATGCYVGDGYVLTAWHVIRDLKDSKTAVCKFQSEEHKVDFGYEHQGHDQALLKLETIPNVPAQRIGNTLAAGEFAYMAGHDFDNSMKLRVFSGVVSARVFDDGDTLEITHVGKRSVLGNSGGPVWNSRNEVVTCISGESHIRNSTITASGFLLTRFIKAMNAAEEVDELKTTLTQYQQDCLPGQVWSTTPGRQLSPTTFPPASAYQPHTHPVQPHKHEEKPHTHPMQDHEHITVPDHEHPGMTDGVGVQELKLTEDKLFATYTDGRRELVGEHIKGTDGTDGTDATFDDLSDDDIAAIVARLPPILVETYDWTGKIKKDSEAYPYPGPIKIRYPKPVPVN